MKLLPYILLLSISIFSCTRKNKSTKQIIDSIHSITVKQRSQANHADTAVIDPNTPGCLPTEYKGGYDEENFSPGTFNNITYVYDSPKTGAKIIDTLFFNTPVSIQKDYPEFYLVCTPKANSGYIKKTDLYLNKMYKSWDIGSYYYLVGVSKYSEEAKKNDNTYTCEMSTLKIVKLNEKQNKILDTYTDSVTSGYTIKTLYSTALKNAPAIFHITYTCYQDIESDWDLFIVDNGKKLSQLIEEGSSGDGGDAQGATVYLPVQLTNGKKIVLAKNGELTLDNITAKPELYPYPANCGIPIDQLVIIQNWDEEIQDGQPDYNPDGTAYNDITITSTDYYKWDGSNLKKVKTIKGKTAP